MKIYFLDVINVIIYNKDNSLTNDHAKRTRNERNRSSGSRPQDQFLVGAFINKRARLLQSLVFFSFFFKTDSKRRIKINVQNLQLKETKRIPRKRIPKGPPFRFLLFKRYLQTWTGLKGPPFRFFFGTVRLFFEIFLSPKGPPFRFLLFKRKLQNRLRLKGPPF